MIAVECPPNPIEYIIYTDITEFSNFKLRKGLKQEDTDPFFSSWVDNDLSLQLSYKSLEHIEFYNYSNDFSLEIPKDLSYLISAFQKSEYILDLEDDWDDDGAEKYNFNTWKKSIDFVYDYSIMLYRELGKKVLAPKIYHGPRKSVDILFENENYTLLINILDDKDKGVYFGKDNFGNTSKGEVKLYSKNYSLLPLAFNF